MFSLGRRCATAAGGRERCPPDTASQERFSSGDRAWARALTETQAALEADGVHLTDQGEVLSELPQAG